MIDSALENEVGSTTTAIPRQPKSLAHDFGAVSDIIHNKKHSKLEGRLLMSEK